MAGQTVVMLPISSASKNATAVLIIEVDVPARALDDLDAALFCLEFE
jgi:hypothetical protein